MREQQTIILVVIVSATLMLILTALVIGLLFQYHEKRILYFNQIEKVKYDFKQNLLNAQLEIQEATLLNISQEIHDNIGLCLTLAKLNINTINCENLYKSGELLNSSKELISKAIIDLSDLSKSINSEVILNVGLIASIEYEIQKIRKNTNRNVSIE